MLPEEILDGLVSENNLDVLQSPDRREQLVAAINHLITQDFSKLVQALYRVDVSEPLLKKMLQDHPNEDAASVIADLMLERQAQKIKARQQWTNNATDIPEEEKW